jgi:chloride channel protein, CIC family
VASRAKKRVEAFHAFLRRHWKALLRIRERIQFREEGFHLLLAGGVGVLGGLVNLVFYHAVESVKTFFLRSPGDPVEIAEMMSVWGRLLTPMLGGLFAGLVLHFGLRIVGPQRPNNILEVVVAGDGRLPFRSGLVKFLSSLVTVGTGGSIGREGAIVELSSTLASTWGRLARWPPYRLRLLVGCGAASGIAAAYNAPISGAVFAALIVLGNFSMTMFAPLVFASVVATMTSRNFFGIKAWYSPPPFEFTSLWQLPWFVVLGVACGITGAVFLKLLRGSTAVFERSKLPIYLRLMLGGLLVGLITLEFPEVWGNGQVITNRILQEQLFGRASPLLVLAALMVAKLLATAITVGSGAVGGVFTPTLFLGASLGAGFGLGLHQLDVARDLPVVAFAVVGMGSVLSATTRSPLLAMIMILEISLDYSLMPPLMLACVISVLVARQIHAESIYTEPLRLKGLSISREIVHVGTATASCVGDVMIDPVRPVRDTTPLAELADRFLTMPNNFIPVVDHEQRLIGLVALHDLKEYLREDPQIDGVIAYDVMQPTLVCVTPDQRLLDVLPVVLASEQRKIPVVNTLTERRLIGALVRTEVLQLFSEAIAASTKPGGES